MPISDACRHRTCDSFEQWAEDQTPNVEKGSVCEEAAKLVTQKRAKEYGSFKSIADKTVMLYVEYKQEYKVATATDVALFMVCFKLAREMVKPKRDNVVDACGYMEIYQKLKDGVEV